MHLPSESALKFLHSERSCVVALPLAEMNSVHAAAMLYSIMKNPLELYFMTESNSRKVEKIIRTNVCSGSVVIGCTEEKKITLQLDGKFLIIKSEDEKKNVRVVHFSRFPKSIPFENESTLFLKFIPEWWRFTDYHFKPPIILP